ncbi:MAG TPA: STAS domain-containing protein [Pedobacter sp.]|jgi:anti-anti-sigma regulatory factor
MQNISITTTPIGNNTIRVLIEGDLVITESEELRDALLNFLHSYQSIDIALKNINRLDVSALQLLVALYNSAQGNHKELNCHFEESEYIDRILKHSGYHTFFNQRFSIL